MNIFVSGTSLTFSTPCCPPRPSQTTPSSTTSTRRRSKAKENVKPAATSLVKLIVSIWTVLALHEAKIVKLADRSYKILSNWRAFVRLFQKYGRLDIFNLVEQYDDLANLEDPPEYLENMPGACAHTDFLELPSVLPAGAIPSPSLPC